MKIVNTKYTFHADIPEDIKFVFISDLHGCKNEPIIALLENEKPCGVLIGGDLIHDSSICANGFDLLEYSSKHFPIFVSLGNHEFEYGGDVRAEIKKRGAILLDNSHVVFKGLNIGGFSSYKSCGLSVPDTKWLGNFANLDGFKILLCHHPEYYEKHIKDLPIDLTVSGHAHGGQWRFFGRGMYAPGQGILPKYTSGLHDGRFIVCRGLGNPHLIPKINNKPEIIILEIKKQAKKEN
ncbi:MAG: hypothetical protein E7633_02290 [Ruminococcaceae bacterium]|nr:hypothetical protein [Oscillospiraceae bacterium]